MNNATELPSTVSEPRRRHVLADFLIRLATEKPLGTFGGIIVFDLHSGCDLCRRPGALSL